jgi:hypothetical protein
MMLTQGAGPARRQSNVHTGGARARRGARRRGLVRVLVAMLLVGASVPALPAAGGAVPFDSHLTRAPYLTDLVGLHVLVNWATDRSATTGSLQWGPVTSGACTLTSTTAAARKSLTVGSSLQYQWKVSLTLPSTGTYCYRPYLGGTDLLAANPSPRFLTQVPAGSSTAFSFGVLGDWGQVDSSGTNADQANVLSQIAASGARFVLTTGDNVHGPTSTQKAYGDLVQVGADTSAVFGPAFWAKVGSSVPIFPSIGNHVVSGTAHVANWPQDLAVASSGGRYQNDTYCCVNDTRSASYASGWYAFDAGPARFYVLDSAWGDTNPGTASTYANDYATHFAPGTPQYEWLVNDLQSHPSGLKFAFSHYPLYSDSKKEPSDTYLQGPANLEGLLTQHGVSMVFNGHAHIYERNVPSEPGAPVTYVTGGGGAKLSPIGPCNSYDAYGIGWGNTTNKGSRCGSAPVPAAKSQVFHFLKVTVDGTSVTVTPTDSLGNTFDVQSYTFADSLPDTVIDSGPPSTTGSDTASFSFHSSITPATFTCSLDGAPATPCTSPIGYSGLAGGSHDFTVTASAAGGTDPIPAVRSWTVDTVPPTVPGDLHATASSPTTVDVSWTASTDTGGVLAYDITRDGDPLATVEGNVTSYTDSSALPATTYDYAIRARDTVGNASEYSPPEGVTTPSPAPPVFADGFESGGLSAWTTKAGLTVQSSVVHSGSSAARATTTNGNTYAKKTLPATYANGYARVWVNLVSTSSQVNLLRLRTPSDSSLAYVFVTPAGSLGLRNDVAGTTTTSATVVEPGSGWHAIELHALVNSTSSVIEVWLDGVRIEALSSSSVNLGATLIGRFQIGEVQSGRTYDVVFDDAAFSTGRIGL